MSIRHFQGYISASVSTLNLVSRLYPITVTSIVVNSMTPNIYPTPNVKINRSGLVQFRFYLVWKPPVVYMKKDALFNSISNNTFLPVILHFHNMCSQAS